LKRAMSLASTNPHEMCRDSDSTSGTVAVKLWNDHGTRCKSVHLAADVMSCTFLKIKIL